MSKSVEELESDLKHALTLGIAAAEESIVRRFRNNGKPVPREVTVGLNEARDLVMIVEGTVK